MPSYTEQVIGPGGPVNDAPKFRRRREQIVAAAVQQFAQNGYHRTKVQDIAARWGFWHLGHFVTDYRRMFGELPSQTLQARRHTNPRRPA